MCEVAGEGELVNIPTFCRMLECSLFFYLTGFGFCDTLITETELNNLTCEVSMKYGIPPESVPKKKVFVLDVVGVELAVRVDGVVGAHGSPADVLNYILEQRREHGGPTDLRINSDPNRSWARFIPRTTQSGSIGRSSLPQQAPI